MIIRNLSIETSIRNMFCYFFNEYRRHNTRDQQTDHELKHEKSMKADL